MFFISCLDSHSDFHYFWHLDPAVIPSDTSNKVLCSSNVINFTTCENLGINMTHFRENGKRMSGYLPVRQPRLKTFQQMVAKRHHIFFISSLRTIWWLVKCFWAEHKLNIDSLWLTWARTTLATWLKVLLSWLRSEQRLCMLGGKLSRMMEEDRTWSCSGHDEDRRTVCSFITRSDGSLKVVEVFNYRLILILNTLFWRVSQRVSCLCAVQIYFTWIWLTLLHI